MKIGLIGAGAIGQFLLKELNRNQQTNLRVHSILVREREKYKELESEFDITLYTELDEFLNSTIDLIVETANIEAVRKFIPNVLKKKDAVLISIGALADIDFLQEIESITNQYETQLHLPSGAVGGLDLLQNAHALGNVNEVVLTTRKPAHSLIEEEIDEEMIVFEGSAVEGIKKFPKNVNVAIILSLAGIGVEKTKIRLVADPYIERNIHQIEIIGDFGEANFTVTNHPLPENPKTSYLAALSILGTLKRIHSRIRIS